MPINVFYMRQLFLLAMASPDFKETPREVKMKLKTQWRLKAVRHECALLKLS